MFEKKFKIIQWLLYGIIIISAIFGVIFYLNPASPDLLIYWGYVLFIVSAILVLGLSLWGILKNPKGAIQVLIIVALMIVLAIISYAMSKNTLSPTELEKYNLTANGVKMVGAGLLLTYFIGIIAIGVFIYTSVSRFLK